MLAGPPWTIAAGLVGAVLLALSAADASATFVFARHTRV
jgi:hypothetical protein